jgi:hypothetical protein
VKLPRVINLTMNASKFGSVECAYKNTITAHGSRM